MSMWLLILLLLAGDVVVGWCWWREVRAHARSRAALDFWRTYRGPRAMDTESGAAAVQEFTRAKVAARRRNGNGHVA